MATFRPNLEGPTTTFHGIAALAVSAAHFHHARHPCRGEMLPAPSLLSARSGSALPPLCGHGVGDADRTIALPTLPRSMPSSSVAATTGMTCLFWRPICCFGYEALATPCPAGPGGAIRVRRMNAVMPTATAPTIEKINCQVSDGIVSLTIPRVA